LSFWTLRDKTIRDVELELEEIDFQKSLKTLQSATLNEVIEDELERVEENGNTITHSRLKRQQIICSRFRNQQHLYCTPVLAPTREEMALERLGRGSLN
jgi:hypothetical protein